MLFAAERRRIFAYSSHGLIFSGAIVIFVNSYARQNLPATQTTAIIKISPQSHESQLYLGDFLLTVT